MAMKCFQTENKQFKKINQSEAMKDTDLSKDPESNLCPELLRHKQVTVLW